MTSDRPSVSLPDSEEEVIWIHPNLLRDVKRWAPDAITPINDYACKVYDKVFIEAREPEVKVGEMMLWLKDRGWDMDLHQDDDEAEDTPAAAQGSDSEVDSAS